MKLLVIHDLPPAAKLRRQTINQSFFYPKYRPGTETILHSIGEPIDASLIDGKYDVIFLDPTLLAWRWARPRSALAKMQDAYGWVAKHRAPKIAFPQDDYDHQAILDEWLASWGVDIVCTPLANFEAVLYPRTRTNALIQPFLTGFIDDIDLEIGARFGSNLAERNTDVVYRARPLPANFGRLGQLKTLVADRTGARFREAGFRTDISTDPSATIFGGQWLEFLGSSKFVLGSPSGSSVLDATGEIGDCVGRFVAVHPQASFDEVYAHCVPEEATRHWMAAISPRCLEAALTRTCQVLVRGEYGPLMPSQHYIAIEPDFSNLDEVMARMKDLSEAQRIADNCYALVTSDASLHYRHAADLVDRALGAIGRGAGQAVPSGRANVSVEHMMEQQIWSRLSEKQALIQGMTQALAAVADAPIDVSRFSEAVEVLGDRWERLNRGYQETSSEYRAFKEVTSKHIEDLEKDLNELKDNYVSLSAKYEVLYTRPIALVSRLQEILKGELLRRLKRSP
ncbi:hypothetical protein [Microvirga rosea]|uniref:hypothetical protein n=1 Tax=Microvirga rosea TaxID=2715425 RepID=UPI001D0BC3CE|nr:hypothetical protein [Microvirga rosea]MCB8820158.1 hypothetical protein [Microvirga rosea]